MYLGCQVKSLHLRKIRLAIVEEARLGDKVEGVTRLGEEDTVNSLFQWYRSVVGGRQEGNIIGAQHGLGAKGQGG